jgi:soluble lytic murein transglycosylase-like protein
MTTIGVGATLAPLGVRHFDMPTTPSRVWQAIRATRAPKLRGWSRHATYAHIAAMKSATCAILLFAASAAAQAAPRSDPSAQCEQAIREAEAKAQTPAGMLAAVGQVESGRPDPRTGRMRPWPWTIDADGAGQFFATKAEAIAAAVALEAAGVRSIDVGCMQVNLMHHPDAFASLEQAFDPASNAAFAARFLRELYRRTRAWSKAIAAYHSDTPHIADDYQRRVMVTWQQRTPGRLGGGFIYIDHGLIYGAFGSTGRIYGVIFSSP